MQPSVNMQLRPWSLLPRTWAPGDQTSIQEGRSGVLNLGGVQNF